MKQINKKEKRLEYIKKKNIKKNNGFSLMKLMLAYHYTF